jgi:malate dehydrogenase (oxaloacetate-decarboxylating)
MAFNPQLDEAVEYRKRYRGLIGVQAKIPVKDRSALALVYTPGVGYASLEVSKDLPASFEYTDRANLIALLTDGSDLEYLGNAGPEAALSVMETRSALFKALGGVDALPVVINSQDPEEIIRTATRLVPTFGAICLDGISYPNCSWIGQQIADGSDIPVLNLQEEATAVVVLAALLNACKATGRNMADAVVVINGTGAAADGIARLLIIAKVKDVIVCNEKGILSQDRRSEGLCDPLIELTELTNKAGKQGSLADALAGADVYIGLPGGGPITAEMLASMAGDSVVFDLSDPEPEIGLETAFDSGVAILGAVSPDYPNQMDTALAYPGLLRGLLDIRAKAVNYGMMRAAAEAIAGLIDEYEIADGMVLPDILDYRVPPAVAYAVAKATVDAGEAGIDRDPEMIGENTRRYLYEGQEPVKQLGANGSNLPFKEEALDLRRRHHGVLEVKSKLAIKDHYVLDSVFLPPASLQAARLIMEDPSRVFDLTAKSNLVAIVSDGTAVLGLGDIGPEGAMPVMEGKAVIFNNFAGVEAFPIVVGTKDPDEIVEVVRLIAPAFGGVNLEDISAPRCFEIERKLKAVTNIPIFHDDQHGTAVIVLAGLLNALKVTKKELGKVRIVINGAGAAAVAVTKLLLSVGAKDIVLCDSKGAVYEGRTEGMNWAKDEIAKSTNREMIKGKLADAIKGADVFVGVSAAGAVTQDMVRSMAPDSILFALANPVPEIMPAEAKAAGAMIVATGRSDFDNQVNNSLAFPGIFRGALDTRSSDINDQMKIAAAYAISHALPEEELRPNLILPTGVDLRVAPKVAAAVAQAAIDSGVARLKVDPAKIEESTLSFVYEGKLLL